MNESDLQRFERAVVSLFERRPNFYKFMPKTVAHYLAVEVYAFFTSLHHGLGVLSQTRKAGSTISMACRHSDQSKL